MARIYSPELKYVIEEALESAEFLGEEFNSLHLLFAMFMLKTSGGLLLAESGFDEEALLPFVNRTQGESPDAVEEVMEFAEETSEKYRSGEVNCLHLVLALCRHRNTMAYRTLEGARVPVPKLRSKAIALLVEMPKRYVSIFEEHRRQKPNAPESTVSMQPSAEKTPPPPPSAHTITTDAAQPRAASQNKQSRSSAATQKRKQSAYPVLEEVATDMLARAVDGFYEPAIGRAKEIAELVDVLNKRKTNNPLIIGPPGVGKSALVEGLAFKLAFEPEALPGLSGRRLFQLDVARLMKGTHLRGSFSDRIDALRREVAEAKGDVIVFLDEIHTIAQGSVDGSHEIAQELKTALAKGQFPCIGATTADEFKKTIERDAALSRRFHVLELDEPDEASTVRILHKVAASYEEHHNVSYADSAIEAAVHLSGRYMRDRHQPDKALTVLDLAGSRARRDGKTKVDERVVAEIISQLTAVPVDQLVTDEAERYLNLEERLAERIVGHRDVLSRIAEALRRNVAGFGGERPMGSFLFVGPTGVGKTEIARSLALELFGNKDAMVRLDMSEFSEAHSVAKMIGAPPGYVGFQEGGALTDAMRRRPFQIVLFDEIEKGHPDVHQLLLQVLDEGRLTDNLGRPVDFTHTVIIMTSNLGSDVFDKNRRGIGFTDSSNAGSSKRRKVLAAVREAFSPELYNRIDEKIVFGRLNESEVQQVARLLLNLSSERLRAEKRIELIFDDGVPAMLARSGGFDPRYGARPMRRAIQSKIEGPLASLILKGDVRGGDSIRVLTDEEAMGFRFLPEPA